MKYDDYGYTKKSKGKLITEKVIPEAVMYSGSTPYLTGKNLSKTHVLHLCSHESEPSWRAFRKAFTVDHQVKKLNVNERVEHISCRLGQGDDLLTQVTS